MTIRDDTSKQASELRRQVEEIALEKPALSLEDLQAMSAEETKAVLHEIRIHQIEREIQKEKLLRVQVELDA